MKLWTLILLLPLGISQAECQLLDPNNTSNGACNAPCASITRYFGSLSSGELVIVVAAWAGPSLKATISDGQNTYHRLSGPINVGSTVRSEVWYTVNSGYTPGVTVTLSGPTQTGWFDGIFIQSIAVVGANRKNPIDLKTIATNAGTGRTFAVTSGSPQFPHEMMWGLFIENAPGAPYKVPSGWAGVNQGEAVSLSEYARSSNTSAESITATAASSVTWAGVSLGVIPAQ